MAFRKKKTETTRTIQIGCDLLRDPNFKGGDVQTSEGVKHYADKWFDIDAPSLKLCKQQGEKVKRLIQAAISAQNSKNGKNDAKWLKVADLIETVSDEVRGGLMNAVGSTDASGSMDATAFTRGAITSPTVGQGGQIGGSFEARGDRSSKLFAATLSCASGVALTLATGGAGAPVGLSVASSCVMLMGRLISGVIEFMIGKKTLFSGAA